jgi:TIR domain
MSVPVFISHTRADRTSAGTVCEALEARGIACWMAERDIPLGRNYGDVIPQAIRASKVMLLIFSEAANASEEIKKEVVLANKSNVVVIPLRVEPVEPRDAYEYELLARQWIDLFDDRDKAIDRLVRQIEATIGRSAPAPAAPSSDAADAVPPPRVRRQAQRETPPVEPPRKAPAPEGPAGRRINATLVVGLALTACLLILGFMLIDRLLPAQPGAAAALEQQRQDLVRQTAAAADAEKQGLQAAARHAAEAVGLDKQRKELAASAEALEQQRRDLTAKAARLDQQSKDLAAQATALDQQRQELGAKAAGLDQQGKDLAAQAAALDQQRRELAAKAAGLEQQRQDLATQAEALEQRRRDAGRQTVAAAASAEPQTGPLATEQQPDIQKARLLFGLSDTKPRTRWTLGSCNDAAKIYSVQVADGKVMWSQTDGDSDVETILASSDLTLRTSTVTSRHLGSAPTPRGTRWIYATDGDQVRVTRVDQQTQFILRPCP